ncbi:Lsr2 family DNA-binding protein [Brevibacterium epidermidis]|uniref:Lsr2 family DNA-binding protein n=1 Tax=Brevibacterium epidermidis TaxID=1698 RepID=UPI000BF769EF|nr:histone-like nucleoid-structuring protein Lsr2 [Brevibacterium epidermidis]
MAIITKTIYVSDVSGDQIEEKDLARAEVTWKGRSYNLALTKDEYKRVEEYLDDLVKEAEVDEPRVSVTRRSRAASATGSGLSSEELAQARAWLQEQGEKVADRGRLKAELVEKWEKAGRPHARR